MQITSVTASWSETCSLGNYSNVKPSLTLTATVGEDENAAEVYQRLTALCRIHVQEEVNQALETEDQPAKYWDGPRYDVRTRSYAGGYLVIIVPAGAKAVKGAYGDLRGLRLAHAQRWATRWAIEHTGDEVTVQLLDCSDGDLAPVQVAMEAADQADAVETKRREQMRADQERAWREEREQRQRAAADASAGEDEEE